MRPGNPLSMPMGASMGAGLRPLLTGYSQDGTALLATGGTLTIPLDGRSYTHQLAAGATTLAISGAPSPPVCADAVIVIKQVASSTLGTLAYPSAWKWIDASRLAMSTGFGSEVEITIRSDANGGIVISGVPIGAVS